jgi:phage terminase large subunit GpA-like protein
MPFPGLPDAEAAVAAAWRRGLAAPPRRTVTEWAEANRILGPEEGPRPGPWSTSLTPYLREPMECMSLHHPARRLAILAASQSAKTQALLNFGGQIIAETPTTVLWVLPSIEEAKSFNRDKLQPMIENTPSVKAAVFDEVSRDDSGSTIMRKRFTGGVLELTGANSSKGLQSRTRRVVIMDEVAEFPSEAGSRGDPVGQAEARTIAHTGEEKIVLCSTPGLEEGDPGPGGRCRITQAWEAGSRGRFMVRCVHCEGLQEPQIEQLRWTPGAPKTARYTCACCKEEIAEPLFRGMVAAGEYHHERPELFSSTPSWRWNCLHSPFVDFATVAKKAEEAADDPAKAKTFSQQWLARAYKPAVDVPKPEILRERRERRPGGRIPPGVLYLMAATDVGANALDWAVWGFDRHMSQFTIDGGILVGDTNLPGVWEEHDELLARTWPDAWGRPLQPECWGIDSGFRTQAVYRYVRRHASRRSPRVMALDGRPKWGLPPIGSPSRQDVDFDGKKIGEVELWPVGTWDLKSELATALKLTEAGPSNGAWPKGAIRFHNDLDIAFFQSLTAEACVSRIVNGRSVTMWKRFGANEQWDLAAYTRALARHAADRLTEADWAALEAERLGPPEEAQADLAQLWAPDLKAQAEEAAKRKAQGAAEQAARRAARTPARAALPRTEWIEERRDWL